MASYHMAETLGHRAECWPRESGGKAETRSEGESFGSYTRDFRHYPVVMGND